MDIYLTFKALHIIFMVSWFAALFYMVRLFVYFEETRNLDVSKADVLQVQFRLMQYRLWNIIGWPAMIGTVTFGVLMLCYNPIILKMPYMHVKLCFVFLLVGYHFVCQNIYRRQKAGFSGWSSNRFRIWNEVATMLLVAIVFVIVFRDAINWIYGVIGFIGLGVVLMLAIKLYKKRREQ